MEIEGENGASFKNVSPVVDFSAGVFAGAAGLVVGQPFDVVKVRYQTPMYAGKYGSTFTALGAILREEGVAGLFKGVTSPMAGIAFIVMKINGVVFTSYSFFMSVQRPTNGNGSNGGNGSDEPSLSQICLAGTGSGILGSTIACPTELIKIRQQSAPPQLNPSTLSVLRSVLLQDGLKGLYRGFSATALRDIAYGPYFCTYEAVCRFFKSRKTSTVTVTEAVTKTSRTPARRRHGSLIDEAEKELAILTWPELMTAGGLAGLMGWFVTFPFDVFKTRMQTVPWEGINGSRKSLPRVAVDAVRNEGWRVMFAGLGPTLIRAVPTNMVIFLTFEGIVTALNKR